MVAPQVADGEINAYRAASFRDFQKWRETPRGRLAVLLIPGRCNLNLKGNETLFWAPKADVRVSGFRDEGALEGDGGRGVWLILAFSCIAEGSGVLVPGRGISGRPEAGRMNPFAFCAWSFMEL